MTRALPAPIIVALILALCPGHPAEAAGLPREKDRWIQVDTANYTLFSNASAATAKSVGEDLEQFRAVLSQLTTGELNAPVPTLIYVFSDDRSFTPYKPVRDGKPEELGSLFQPRQHANYISLNGALRDQASETVYTMHAFHFLHNNLPGLPLWFNRGLAEYYGTLEIEKDHANVGKPDINHLRRLREHPTIHLAELFATEEHPDYRLGEPAYLFDAQCWVVVHYLLTRDPERTKQTYAFIGQLMGGVPQHAAFESAFKTTYDGLQQELTSYIRQFKFGYLHLDLAKLAGEEPRVTPMAYADVLYRLGDLLANQSDPRPEALEHFQAALQADPRHALALAGLGQVEEQQGRHEAALEHYRQAAALDPDDFQIQYRYASSLLEVGGKSRVAEAQQALERCVAANPSFAPAWAKLAYAYAFDDKPSKQAIAAAETAHRLLPSEAAVASNLLLLYTKAGLREPAQTLIDRYFVPQATAEELADARSRLAYLDIEAAYELLRDDQIEPARKIYYDLRAAASSGQLSPRMVDQVRNLAQDIKNRHLYHRLNEAVDRYNAGDFATARDLLQEVLSGSQDASLTAQANELSAAVEKQLGGGGG
jgi:Tfp pilus assembly protein PilF